MDSRKTYAALMSRSKERPVICGYTELHHITPRAHGGDNSPGNLVRLTAREHFVAHWLLWRIHRDAATARSFRLLCDDNGRPRSRGYAAAKECYAASMHGEANVAKRPEVRAKISAALCANHPYTGIKRPAHRAMLVSRGKWGGTSNPWFGTGARQVGAANHMARAVVGEHSVNGHMKWATLQEVSAHLGVSIQAVCRALRRNGTSRGWKLEYVV